MTYYFDANGNNGANGLSPATAWKTLGKASSFIFQPGDTVLFKRGDTFTGTWNVNTGGSLASPITYGTYGTGANPIIPGQTTCNDRQNIIFDGLDFTGATSTWGAGFFCKPTWQAPKNITLRNCEFYNNSYAGVWFEGGAFPATDGITIDNCPAHNNGTIGIFINGKANRFTNVSLTNSIIRNNGSSTVQGYGVHIEACNAPVVTGNDIYSNEGSHDWAGGLYITNSPNSTVQFNRAHDNVKTNYHFDVNSNGFICKYNLSYNAPWQGYWVEEHLVANGASFLEHNISYNDGRSLYFGPGGTIFEVSGVTMRDNACINPTESAIGIDWTIGGQMSDFLNNTVDYNNYVATHIGHTTPPNTDYDMAAWRALTGFDTNSFSVG